MQISDASITTKLSLSQVLVEATARLSEAGIQSAELEAVWLLERALHLTSLGLMVDRDRILHPKECAAGGGADQSPSHPRATSVYLGHTGILRPRI